MKQKYLYNIVYIMCVVDSCCCCISLRTGTIIILIWWLIQSLAEAIEAAKEETAFFGLVKIEDSSKKLSYGIALVQLVTVSIGLYGVISEKVYLLKFALIVAVIGLSLNFIKIVLTVYSQNSDFLIVGLLIAIISTLLPAYFVLVMYSYYRQESVDLET